MRFSSKNGEGCILGGHPLSDALLRNARFPLTESHWGRSNENS